MKQDTTVIIGLGNPGKKYEKTRHNTGFRVVDVLRKRYRFSQWEISEKYYAFISEGAIAGKKIVLAKPYTFMNNSGKAVKKIATNVRLTTSNLFVIHDDISLPLGVMRIVKNRGSAGHQGVKSIIKALGTKDFVRLRIGIDTKNAKKINLVRGGTPNGIKDFVLQKFTPAEEKILKKIMLHAILAIELALTQGLARAMTEYNR